MADNNRVYILFRGTPNTFFDLQEAEEMAAELCERDHEDYTILSVEADVKKSGIVARCHGVVLHALDEVME